MLFVPRFSEDVKPVALPVLGSMVAVPISVEPFMNVTVPVGVPPEPLTLAVNATSCPTTIGLFDAVSMVVLLTLPVTLKLKAADVLVANAGNPSKVAVMLCIPELSAVNPTAVCVVGSTVAVPISVEPSLNETTPPVDPLAPLTVAVSAMSCPATGELVEATNVVVVASGALTIRLNGD